MQGNFQSLNAAGVKKKNLSLNIALADCYVLCSHAERFLS